MPEGFVTLERRPARALPIALRRRAKDVEEGRYMHMPDPGKIR